MEESTIELGTMILERHRSTYQVRLEGMRPREIESVSYILRFVASLERRWILEATETTSIPLLMQISGSPAPRQNRVIVPGHPLEKAQQGGAAGDIPIEQSAASVSSSDHDHAPANPRSGTPVSEASAHSDESKNATSTPDVSEMVKGGSSSSAGSPSPPMTDRTPHPAAAPASTVPPASEVAASPGTAAEGSRGQAAGDGSAAGMPRAQTTEAKPQTSAIDPDTVLSGAALLWTSAPLAKDADAARETAVKAFEASLPHPHPTPTSTVPKKPPEHVVTGTEAPAGHPPAMEHPVQGTTPSTAPHMPTASATPPTDTGAAAAQHPGAEQGGAPQKSAPAPDPAREAAKKAEEEKRKREYDQSTVKGELLFGSPHPEPVLLAPVPAAQAASHAPAQSPQAVPAHPEAVGVSHAAAPQGIAEHGTPSAVPSRSNEVDLDTLRTQFLRVFARDMALEAERRGVDTWDR
jgi:hypothetical protein